MVQPSFQLKRENKPWKNVSAHRRQMLSKKLPTPQDFQQIHTKIVLLMHG